MVVPVFVLLVHDCPSLLQVSLLVTHFPLTRNVRGPSPESVGDIDKQFSTILESQVRMYLDSRSTRIQSSFRAFLVCNGTQLTTCTCKLINALNNTCMHACMHAHTATAAAAACAAAQFWSPKWLLMPWVAHAGHGHAVLHHSLHTIFRACNKWNKWFVVVVSHEQITITKCKC